MRNILCMWSCLFNCSYFHFCRKGWFFYKSNTGSLGIQIFSRSIDTILLKDQIVTYRLNAKNVSAFGDRLSDFRMTMRMDYDQMVLDVLDTYVFYNDQIILNPVMGSLDFKNKDVLFPFRSLKNLLYPIIS